jgi:hypothetical protein
MNSDIQSRFFAEVKFFFYFGGILLALPLAWFGLMSFAFGGWNLAALPALALVPFAVSIIHLRAGQILFWIILVASFFSLWISPVWWALLLDAILLQLCGPKRALSNQRTSDTT